MVSSFSLTNVSAAKFTLFGTIVFLFFKKLRSHKKDRRTASSLSLLSLPSSLPHTWKHHVFPSFHGADVRKAFLGHILKEFRSKGIEPFIDNDIDRSKSIGPELVEAIRGSRIAIALLSKNYASSTWCLDELVEIIKCRETFGQTVMVLFYEVDPTDVKKQTGHFGKVFRKTCKGKTKDDIGRWKEALVEVAQIAGYHSRNWANEAEMIETIATDVSNKLNISTPSSDFDNLVGMESHLIKMGSLLQLDFEEVRMIGILGPPGTGKTTIARFLFNQHAKDFQLSVFMENIKTNYAVPACSNDYSVKKYLQEQFMSQLINEEGFKIPHLGIVKDRLKDKKVLVVLDDVNQLVQLEAMAKETNWFGPWSRIIITTQYQKLLQGGGVNHIYNVGLPSNHEALQMFCVYAFGKKSPKDGFRELAWQVTRLVGELPLGLRIMGSYFRGMSEKDWKKALPRLMIRLDGEIESVLKFSYDALRDEDKMLFLHIACFFNNEQVDIVESCLENSLMDVKQGLQDLDEKSLISMDWGMIKMHSLLCQLGREIVRKRSISDPGKRQYLDDARNVDKLLSDDNADNSNDIGIYLRLTYKHKEDIICTNERALSNLQFLRVDGDGTNPQNLNSISRKLRLLSWKHFPMPCFPSNFHTKFLVKLEMYKSQLEKLWEGNQPLSNLKWMDLMFSSSLKELPDLSTATNLCELDLSYCSSLVQLPTSIGSATNLQKLNLYRCSNLVELPSTIGNAIHLQKLNLGHCSSLVDLPSSIGNATNLEYLYTSHCSNLVGLPSSMRNLGKLSKLYIEKCSKLEVCLSNINLESLEELDLSDCSLLKSCHETGEVKASGIQEFDPWIGRISCLRRLVLSRMRMLVSLPQLPYSLKELDAGKCESLERLDCSFLNPDIRLNFAKCFKLNQEARDLIVQTRTNEYAVLPGGEVPACFTYRASGSSLTLKLNQKPLGTSAKFRACIVLVDKGTPKYLRFWEGIDVNCSITSKPNALTACSKTYVPVFPEHMYTFEVEAETVEVTELVFEFKLDVQDWEIKECGIIQLMEVPYNCFRDGDEDSPP